MNFSFKMDVHVTDHSKACTYTLEKNQSDLDKESENYMVRMSMYTDNQKYENSKEFGSMEFAIIDLQKTLPRSIAIVGFQGDIDTVRYEYLHDRMRICLPKRISVPAMRCYIAWLEFTDKENQLSFTWFAADPTSKL